MRAAKSVKAGVGPPNVVAVISSREELRQATRLRHAPDYFELRLDCLQPMTREVETDVGKLTAALIITARHPDEGGKNDLRPSQRRDLLLRFLTRAAYVDVELRSIQELAPVLARADRAAIKLIISVHDFERTPSTSRLDDFASRARVAGADIFKLATRTDTPADLDRLLAFFDNQRETMKISAMGVGKLGRTSRFELMKRGSVLNYVHLGAAHADGQLSLSQIRRLTRIR